ncbi:MAG: hypothetical protein ACI8Z9_000847 [Paraglaciecola sp.]|jgi:hypothetical protein
MMTEQQNTEMSQEQLSVWVREQFQRANKHLAENGVLFDSVVTEVSRYLAPFVAVWKIKSSDNKYFWVISGDLPCDFFPFENEATARAAIRRFSMLWQIKAENINRLTGTDKTQQDFANLLIAKAEDLYTIQADESVWKDYTS